MKDSSQTESDNSPSRDWPGRSNVFATTHWSVLLAAKDQASPEASAALEHLCRTYWYPLYAHARRHGYSEADAQDLTQGLFSHLLEHNAFQNLSPAKGKFRSFLLAAMNHFLSDARDRAMALKRGGGREVISFDAHAAEERYALEPLDEATPDKIFERRWALALLDQVMAQLKAEFTEAGKDAQYNRLAGFLIDGAGGTYAEAAADLGLTEEAIKKTVQRMRQRYGELFRQEIASTVDSPLEIEQELRYLGSLLR